MKNHKKYLSILVLGLLISCISVFGVQMPSVYAEDVGKGDGGGDGGHHYDTDIYPYSLSFSATQNDTSRPDSNVRITESEFVSSYPIFLYRLDNYADDYFPQSYRVGIYDSETDSVLAVTNSISKNYKSGMLNLKYIQSNYAKKDNEIGNLLSQHDYSGNDYLNESSYFQIYSLGDFTTDAIVFRSQEAALSYYRDGDRGGIFQEPAPDFSKRHDFSKDSYYADLPVPELSNLSHNGFIVNNASEDLFIDVVVDSKFYGLYHYTYEDNLIGTDVIGFVADKSWVYSSHYWNLADYSDVAINSSQINIKSLWGVDNEAALMEDLKKWKLEYPTDRYLPDYSFWSHSSGRWYSNYQGYLYDSSLSNSANLKNSGQAFTTYYVRFYSYDKVNGLRYGKWVSYTLSSNGFAEFASEDDVVVGDVIYDDNGNPHVSNPVTGQQSDDGTIDFSSSSAGISTIDASDLWATIRGLVNSMGDVPDMVSACFSFLPSWLTVMLAFGIAALVVLRIVGR